MAVVTFLPNVFLGSWLQRKMYNEGQFPFKAKLSNKVLFVLIMAFVTVVSFVARMLLVYKGGYQNFMEWLLKNVNTHCKVALAVAVPPMIDGIQSTALIMTGSHAKPLLADIIDGQRNMKNQMVKMEAKLVELEKRLKNIETIPDIRSKLGPPDGSYSYRTPKADNCWIF
mmetsp:Transcript_65753/g.171159  ORF Transcript_65753/g.171159 Transcript_65753/m.171159 type:complete len:170 (-) Transcript_65753:112-621(-)